MKRKKILKTESNELGQMKSTLESQITRYNRIRRAKKQQQLLNETTTRMQISLNGLDTSNIKDDTIKARMVSKNADNISDRLFNPFSIDNEEIDEDFEKEFDALNFDNISQEEDEKQQQQQQQQQLKKISSSRIIDSDEEDIFLSPVNKKMSIGIEANINVNNKQQKKVPNNNPLQDDFY